MCFRRFATNLAVVVLMISPHPLAAQTNGYLIGTGQEDITPAFPIRMTGYGNRQFESSGIEQHIFARAFVIREEGSNDPAVICTVELLGITPEIRRAVLAEVNKSKPLASERLMLCATHTHTAPCVNGVCPLILGDTIRPAEQERIDRYTRELVPKISKAIIESLSTMKEGRLSFARGKVGFAVNRRVLKEGTWAGFGVTNGPVDHQLPILVAQDNAGKVLAVVANYACHCTTFGGRFNKIAGDWAGNASAMIEKQYPGSVALGRVKK